MPNLYFVAMTKYYKEYDGPTFLVPKDIKNTLSEVLSNHDLRQFHLAETEKFAHVTKFFNAEKEIVYDGQKNTLIPSHKVATYDLDPAMSAPEILKTLLEESSNFDAFIVNFAN
jgi:2,3-bisphosphoglycerate-independent phosphoglycerate mutase